MSVSDFLAGLTFGFAAVGVAAVIWLLYRVWK